MLSYYKNQVMVNTIKLSIISKYLPYKSKHLAELRSETTSAF